jgi:uncharacterized membrane protein
MEGLAIPDLGKKEAALFSGDIASAFFLRVLLLLDVLLPLIVFFAEAFLRTGFVEDARLLIFFLRLSS